MGTSVLTIFTFPAWVVWRIVVAGLNQRNILGLAFNFCLNFSPVFVWLFIFKNASLIPNDIRPPIHSQAAFVADNYLFGNWWGELEREKWTQHSEWAVLSAGLFGITTLIAPLGAWYYIYYVKRIKHNVLDWYDYLFHSKNEYRQGLYAFRPTRPRVLLPFLLPFAAFMVLNFDYLFAAQDPANFSTAKDILAWFFYVILHLTAPILTAVYLYAFHAPGTMKCFSFALGLQNIVAVCTHLLMPMAPPWFVHMYGLFDTEHVNYDQEGFAAGLTRVDTHLGTHLNTNGFHKSPIVFGCVPSVHSAIAVQCFLFLEMRSCSSRWTQTVSRSSPMALSLDQDSPDTSDDDPSKDLSFDSEDLAASYPSRDLLTPANHMEAVYTSPEPSSRLQRFLHSALLPRVLGASFLVVQWWATMYLDHHFRYDLFVGMLYAVASHLVVNKWVLQPLIRDYCDVRLGNTPDDRNEAATMGMRVFERYSWKWFFDPFA